MGHIERWRWTVAITRWILFLLAAVLSAGLAGCGGSTANVQNPPPPVQTQITVAFSPQPAPTVAVSFSENVIAVVSNDSSNEGVDWSLTCSVDPKNQQGLCGSFSVPANAGSGCTSDTSKHTASGCPITYNAPASLNSNSMVVEIVALSTANNTDNAVAPITVTTFNNTLAGTYVLQASGVDSSFNPYEFAGVVVLDGQGDVTGGEQTVNFADPATGLLVTRQDGIIASGSGYFLGSDGRGTITLNPNNDTDIGTEVFSFVFLSDSQAFISAQPTNNLSISAAGTLDLQPSAPLAPAGGYAFVMNGLGIAKSPASPLAFGGVFNIDSANTISGNGSVADEILAKKLNASAATLSGTVTSPDAYGAVTLNLSAGFGANGKATPFQLTGYIIDSTHIKLIETDATAGTGFGLTAGIAAGQGPSTGSFVDNTAFSGTYVFGVLGTDLSNSNLAPATLTEAAVVSADGSGSLNSGYTDTFLAVNTIQQNPVSGAQISASFNGTFAVDATGTGRTVLTVANFNPAPKKGYQPVLIAYLTGSGSADNPLVLEGGDSHYPSVGSGIAYQQSGALTFSGDYGFNFTQEQSGTGENDGTAPMSASAGTLAGYADVDLGFSENTDQPFTGTFASPATNGLSKGTLVGTNNNVVTSVVFTPQIGVDYYVIDSGHGFFIETDLINAQAPEQTGQVSLGYWAPRTPVCDGCQVSERSKEMKTKETKHR